VVEIERHIYLGKHIVTLSSAGHIKLDTTMHAKSHHFSLLPSSLLLFIHCSMHRTNSHATMIGETAQISPIAGDVVGSGSKGASGVESNTASASSSSNVATHTIAKKKVPMLYENWKVPTITEVDLTAYHATGWLLGGMLSSTTDLEFPTINKTVIVYFESHLMARLGLSPSKFLVSILNYLKCEVVHLNPHAIVGLSCFNMLCECWLRIPPDTSLF
jgi:hypothetical protein